MDTQPSETPQPGPSNEQQSDSTPAAPSEAAAPATPAADATAEAPAADDADPYSAAKDLDPDKLLAAHPGLKRHLDSRAGEVADRLARRRETEVRERVRAELEAERQAAYLDQLVEQDDLVGLGEDAKRRVLAERQHRQQQTSQQQISAHADALLGQAVIEAFGTLLPKHLGAVLYEDDGQTYKRWAPGGTTAQGIAELVRAAVDRGVEAELKARLPDVKAELRQAIQRELNGETLGDEPAPDTRGGGTAPSRVITDVGPLSLPEFDALFDEKGLPKQGVTYRPRRTRVA